jgi:hypothetical protein
MRIPILFLLVALTAALTFGAATDSLTAGKAA